MGTPDEKETKENRTEPLKFNDRESLISETESLSPEDGCFVCGQHRHVEGQQGGCESRVMDEIRSAACDCHGDGCCC